MYNYYYYYYYYYNKLQTRVLSPLCNCFFRVRLLAVDPSAIIKSRGHSLQNCVHVTGESWMLNVYGTSNVEDLWK